MRQLFLYIKPYRKYYLFLGVILLVTAILTALSPYFFKLIIDDGIIAKRFDVLINLLIVMLVIELATMVFNWLQTYLFTKVGQNIIRDIKTKAYKSLTLKSPNFFTKYTVGDLIERIDGDTIYPETTLTRNLVNLGSDSIMVIAMAGFLIYLNYQLFLFASIVLPAAYFAQKIIGIKVAGGYAVIKGNLSLEGL